VANPPALRPARPAWSEPGTPALAVILLAAVVLAYFPALLGGFLWDDDAHVTRAQLRSLHGLWRIWSEVGATQQYYPVLHTAFWAEHRLWGDHVLGYHLVNILFHAAAAWLLAAILRRVAFPFPALAAVAFALHPVCAESVAWISEQKNTLSALFYLGSALVYLWFDETRRRGFYAGAFALFILALLTKSVTASLPGAILVALWWRRPLEWKRDVVPLVPWFAIGAVSGLFTAWAEARLIGADGADFSFDPLERLLLACRAVLFYLGKALWPVDLMFIYPRWSIGANQVGPWLAFLTVAALLAVLVALARKSRGPLTAFLFFLGTLLPVLGFVNVYPFLFSFVADHFQYLALIGIVVPSAWAIGKAAARLPIAAGAFIVFAVPSVLGVLTWRECRMYRDSDVLYRTTISRNPGAWLMHYNLAVVLGERPGGLAESIAEYRQTLKLNPRHWAAHNNLATALLKTPGHTDEAIAEYEAALRLNPAFAEAHNNLGVALAQVPGGLGEAVEQERSALRLRPDYDAAHDNLGVFLMRTPGSLADAVAQFEEAVRIAPGNAGYHYNLANALSRSAGRLAEAEFQYREALRLRPDLAQAHSNLGAALARMPGRLADAIAQYEAAARLEPGNAQIHANLGNALSRADGRRPEAVAEYGAALRLDPKDVETHLSLGVVLSGMPGRLPDALAEFTEAARLEPDSATAQYCLGVALARIGRPAQAQTHLESAVRLRPDFAEAKKALAQLREESR
jgi:tetratricopeptide (TPR) repeat protein